MKLKVLLGPDIVPVELVKYGGTEIRRRITKMFFKCLELVNVPINKEQRMLRLFIKKRIEKIQAVKEISV